MKLFSSEAVTKGHPDKLCDQIADAILDACFKEDKDSHVACEVSCTTDTVILMGEITTNAKVNYEEIARNVIKEIGYRHTALGMDYKTCGILDLIEEQSPEINSAVNTSLECRECTPDGDMDLYDSQGAGDQGIMFGYACNETEELMPLSHMLAHDLARRLEYVREEIILPYLRPDGKTQVTVKYDDDGKILGIDTILISTQHNEMVSQKDLEIDIIKEVIAPVLRRRHIDVADKILINPSGSFTIGGPHGDTGLTGRKLAVDTYGGYAKFGGGALCGKDPSKVDRSGAYMSRYIAKHIVASGLAESCEVQLAYAIGKANPVSIWVCTNGTGKVSDQVISDKVSKLFDTRPLAIIEKLKLKTFKYYSIAGNCQFKEMNCPWEELDEYIISELYSLLGE